MKYLKLILIAMFILLSNCELFQVMENVKLEDAVKGVWYLKSYTRDDTDGVSQTISLPYDVAQLFEDDPYELEQNKQHLRIMEYYVEVKDTIIQSYYKVDFKEINLDTNVETVFIQGIYFDDDSIETYYVGEDEVILSSNESISGMDIKYVNDELILTGEGEIVLTRASESDIKNISPSNDHEIEHCRFCAYYAIYKVFFGLEF